MNRSRVRRRVPIPSITTNKTQTKDIEFKKGLDTNSSNDEVAHDQWRYATDTREVEIGRWETCRGSEFFSVPVGEAVNVQQTSTTGAADQSFNVTTRLAKKIVATATGRLSLIESNLKNDAAATGTVVVALYTDSSGAPGTELVRTTIDAAAISTTYGYVKARTITCPDIANGTTYWVVYYVQTGGSGSYKLSSTTNASTGLVSTNSGQTWSAASVDFNVKVYTATASGVLGTTRVTTSNGTTYTFIAHGNTLYQVNEVTGATTAVDTGLNASSTYVRFEFVNDTLYYVTGLQKPRKYNFTTASEVTDAPEFASHIIEHKGLLFFVSATDKSKSYYSNFAGYDTFASTDFLYVPAPKTSDPVKAVAKLNGNLFYLTRDSKYTLYGSENATFRLDTAIGQKGTFSQESVAYDQSFIYLASDDGIFKFNGAEERNLCSKSDGTGVLDWWMSLPRKDDVTLALHDNRLFIFYPDVESGENDRCAVYNILYDIWESFDTRTYINRVFSRYDQDNYFIQGSNRVGMLMLGERDSCDYNRMGEPLTWEHHTAYNHYDSPAQFKTAPTFRPHFDTTDSNYSVEVGYARDFSESPIYKSISLQGTGPRFDTGVTFDSGATYGGQSQVYPMDDGVQIPGEFRRLQIRYKHEAAREPVSFSGHVLKIETQRLI